MASSTNQRHADTLRHLVAVFRQEEISLSSVEWLTGRVLEVADRLAPPASAPKSVRRGLRAVRS